MAYKPTEFHVESTEAFQDMVDEKDFAIAEAIVEGIMANLDTTKKHIHLLSVIIEEENSIFDVTIERKHFIETLEENIVHYVREERYEDCQRIADVINKLKGKQIGKLLNQISSSKK